MGLAGDEAQSARLFQNNCAWDTNWLRVQTVGTVSNRDGIGARVTVVADGRTQIREIAAGSSNKSQSMLPAHFGLGRAAKVDTLQIRWPSGIVQTLHDVPPKSTADHCRGPAVRVRTVAVSASADAIDTTHVAVIQSA